MDQVKQGALRNPIGTVLTEPDEKEKEQIKDARHRMFFGFGYFFLSLFKIKNPAFKEEKEWRLVSVQPKDTAYTGLSYRSDEKRVIPYFPFSLNDEGFKSIKEIWLGPRNITPKSIVEEMLKEYGLTGVKIEVSSASYR